MHIFNTDTFFPIVQKYIEEIRLEGKTSFYTVDFIRKYRGKYLKDKANAYESVNANIGKFIKEHMVDLRIRNEIPNQPVKDDEIGCSHSSLWEF